MRWRHLLLSLLLLAGDPSHAQVNDVQLRPGSSSLWGAQFNQNNNQVIDQFNTAGSTVDSFRWYQGTSVPAGTFLWSISPTGHIAGPATGGRMGAGTINAVGYYQNGVIFGGTPGGTSGQIQYNNAGVFGGFTTSGDATINTGTGALTLATVNANVGTFGSATTCITTTANAKGLITAISAATCTPAIGSITGLGANVAAFLATPSSANLATAVTGETGTGALVFATSPALVTPALGTPASGVITNLTGSCTSCTASNATLAATVTTNANLTGPVTSTGNATAIANNQITRAMEAQGVARSVIGVTGNATANVADIQGTTANTFLGVNTAGTGIAFQSLRQIIPFSLSTVPLPQATTIFTLFLGNATELNVSASCPISGTFRNLSVFSTAPAAGQTLTATLRVSLADTALTCTITGPSTTCNDTTHSVACATGNIYGMKLVTSATTGTLAAVGGGFEFDTP